MLRRSEFPAPELELPSLEEDPALFDPSPEWFVSGLRPALREDAEELEGLGLRSLFDQPDVMSKAWRRTGNQRAHRRATRAKVRLAGRPNAA